MKISVTLESVNTKCTSNIIFCQSASAKYTCHFAVTDGFFDDVKRPKRKAVAFVGGPKRPEMQAQSSRIMGNIPAKNKHLFVSAVKRTRSNRLNHIATRISNALKTH